MDLFAEFKCLDMGERLGRFITQYRTAYFTPDKMNGQIVYSYKLLPGAQERIYNKISDITISMSVDRDDKGQLYYEYTLTNDDAPTMKGSTVRLSPSDVLHIPGLGFDGLVGYSPIAMAKNAIGLAIATEEYGSKFFANGAAPSGVLEHPGTLKDPAKIRESWQQTFGGSSNAHKVAVLEEGMKYTPISISPEQAQFLETRKFQIDEIARIFRVPPHMVGDLERSTFSNIEQQSLEFVKYTLDPCREQLKCHFQQKVIPRHSMRTTYCTGRQKPTTDTAVHLRSRRCRKILHRKCSIR